MMLGGKSIAGRWARRLLLRLSEKERVLAKSGRDWNEEMWWLWDILWIQIRHHLLMFGVGGERMKGSKCFGVSDLNS